MKLLATLLLTPALALAQAVNLPSPILSSISPLGGTPGETLDLSFKGSDLDGPSGLLFSPPIPVTAKPKLDAKGQPLPNQLLLALPPDTPSGTYEVRFIGTYGISNPRVFQVSTLPVTVSPGSNSKTDTALKIEPGTAIHGTFKSAEPHWFEVRGKAGQRLLAAFSGAAFDSRARLMGALIDASGREIARLRDGLLDARLPADGSYRLKAHDLMFGTGDEFSYRLSVTTGPVVYSSHHTVNDAKVTLYGWNLPGGELLPSLRVSPGQPLERLLTDSNSAAKLTSASPLPVFTLPSESESPAQNPPDSPTPIAIGQSHASWFPPRGASRRFDLAFKSGDRFVIEVHSALSGFPSDPALLIENVKKDSAGVETLTAQAELADAPPLVPAPTVRVPLLDPAYAFEAKSDGVFRLSVSDPLNAANGRRYPFTLRIRPLADPSLLGAIAVHPTLPRAAPTGPYDIPSANIWRGGITAIEVALPLRGPLSPPQDFQIGGLPPGVTFLGGFAGQNQRLAYLAFKADAAAAPGAALLASLSHTAHLTWPVKDSNRESLFTRVGGPPALGIVAEPAPASVQAGSGTVVEIAAGGKADLPLKVHRHPAFTDALTLKVLGLVDPAKAPSAVIAAKASDGKLTLDTKALALPVGEYGFILQSPAKMPFRRGSPALSQAEIAAIQAASAVADAQKALDSASADLKALQPGDTEAVKTAQARVKSASEALALSEKNRASAAKAAQDLAAKFPPKDTAFTVYSNPVRLRVTQAAKP